MKNLEKLRAIIRDHQYEKIGNLDVDVQSANRVLQVLDALSEKNQVKYAAIIESDIALAIGIAWEIT